MGKYLFVRIAPQRKRFLGTSEQTFPARAASGCDAGMSAHDEATARESGRELHHFRVLRRNFRATGRSSSARAAGAAKSPPSSRSRASSWRPTSIRPWCRGTPRIAGSLEPCSARSEPPQGSGSRRGDGSESPGANCIFSECCDGIFRALVADVVMSPKAGARSRRRNPGDLTTGCDTSASPLTPAFPDARSLGVPARSSAAGATAAITSKGGLAVAIRASGKPDMRKFPSVRSTRTKIERKRPSAKVLLELVAARATGVVSGRRPRCSRAR